MLPLFKKKNILLHITQRLFSFFHGQTPFTKAVCKKYIKMLLHKSAKCSNVVAGVLRRVSSHLDDCWRSCVSCKTASGQFLERIDPIREEKKHWKDDETGCAVTGSAFSGKTEFLP